MGDEIVFEEETFFSRVSYLFVRGDKSHYQKLFRELEQSSSKDYTYFDMKGIYYCGVRCERQADAISQAWTVWCHLKGIA